MIDFYTVQYRLPYNGRLRTRLVPVRDLLTRLDGWQTVEPYPSLDCRVYGRTRQTVRCAALSMRRKVEGHLIIPLYTVPPTRLQTLGHIHLGFPTYYINTLSKLLRVNLRPVWSPGLCSVFFLIEKSRHSEQELGPRTVTYIWLRLP